MKPEIENLKVWMSGRSTTGYQRALAMREFEQLLIYVAELEQLRQPPVMGSVCDGCGSKFDAMDISVGVCYCCQKEIKQTDL